MCNVNLDGWEDFPRKVMVKLRPGNRRIIKLKSRRKGERNPKRKGERKRRGGCMRQREPRKDATE